MVNPQFPVKSVPELIAYAKANPGKINVASAGVGTGPHVACELFKMMTGTDMVQVPYKGSYMTDLLGGQIPIAFGPIAQIIEDVRAGKLIAHRADHADPFGRRAGYSRHRRIRAGLCGGRLVRHLRDHGHAGRHRRETERGDQRRRQRSRH